MARKRLIYRRIDMEHYWDMRFKHGFNEKDCQLNFWSEYVKSSHAVEESLNKQNDQGPAEMKLGFYKKNRKS